MNWEDVGMSAGRWALTNSAGAAVIAILVFIVQTLLGDRISPRWRHNLWLLVVVRLMLPALPGIRLPLPHFPHETAQTSRAIVSTEAPKDLRSATTKVFHSLEESEHPAVADSLPVETAVSEGHSSEAAPVGKDEIVIPSVPTSVSAKRISQRPFVASMKLERPAVPPMRTTTAALPLWTWAFAGWLSGAVLVAGWFLFTTLRLWLVTRRFTPVENSSALRLLDQCSQTLGLKRRPLLVSVPADFGPALIGLFRPRLVVPQYILATFSQQELRSILLHEMIHCRRRDVGVNYLLAALSAIHWFNPLVWFAFARLRAERELACDQAVMKLSPPRERLAYGCTILKLLELSGRGGVVSTAAVGVIGNKGLMQRRIAMIARFDRRQTARPLAAAALSILVAGAAFAVPTFAQEKPAPPPIQAPPAVDQARQAIEAAAAKPAPSVAPEPPNVPEPLAPPPVATTPPPPASAQVGRPFPDGPPNGFRQSATEPPAPAIQDKRSANEFGAGPRSIEDASSTAANFKTMERLKQPHPLDSQGVPLRDVLRMIADLGKLDIVTDDQALSDALNAPVNMTVHEARPLEQLLEMSLRLAGPQVDYTVLNGVIFVSSRSELNGRVVTRVYDVGNADHDAITDLLTNGTGLVSRVSFAGNKLVITASELTQRHVAKLLSAVSDQMSQHRVGQAMRGLGPDDTTIHALRFAEAQSIKQVVQSACSPNVKIMVDSRTNSMIITGGGDDQKLAAAIIAKLDVPPVERTTAQPAEDTMTKLRALAELALKMSERYGAHSKQLEDVGKQVDTLGNEVSTWIDRLAKDGKLPEAEKLRSELDQIKTLLAPLAKEVQGNRPPEPTRPETAR